MSERWYRPTSRNYNDISDDIMQGAKKVLEFGPALGINQLASRHRDFFFVNNAAGRYRGIDIRTYDESYLNIEQGDIRTFDTEEQYDIILALHVFEHIDLSYWYSTFRRLRRMVACGGYLIVGVPWDESEEGSQNEDHVVFNITRKLLARYLPDADIREIRNYRFHEDGVRFLWALGRFVKRWLMRHPVLNGPWRLLAIWRKEAEDNHELTKLDKDLEECYPFRLGKGAER